MANLPAAPVNFRIMDQSGTNILRAIIRFTSLSNPQQTETNVFALREFSLLNTNNPLTVNLHAGRWAVAVRPFTWTILVPPTNQVYEATALTESNLNVFAYETPLPWTVVAGSNTVVYATNGVYVINANLSPTNLGSGSAITSKFLRGDGTWQTIAGGGDLLAANNLGDVADTAAALANLGGVNTNSATLIARKEANDATNSLASNLAAVYQPLDADLTDLADGLLTGSKVQTNNWGVSGVVQSSQGQTNKFWGTDADGLAGWQADVVSTNSATLIARKEANDATNSLASNLAAVYQPLDADLTDLADGVLTGTKVQTNTWGVSGVVQSSQGQTNKFWGTDSSGLPGWQAIAGGGDLLSANNLSDVSDAAAALANLGGVNTNSATLIARKEANDATNSLASNLAAVYQPLDADLTDLADGVLTGTKVQTNTWGVSGVVQSSQGQTNKFWGTDADGLAGWQADVVSTNSATLIARKEANDATNSLASNLAAVYQPLDADLTDLADGVLTGTKVQTNTWGVSGVVQSSQGQTNKFWGTDSDGLAGWRATVADAWLSANVSLLGSAIDLSGSEATGTLAAGRFPALTGDVTTTAGSLATTIVNVDAATATIKMKNYLILASPFNCDGTGAILQTNDYTKAYFGQALFSNSADEAANFVEYRITVPEDIDTSVEIKVARLKFRLGGADTGTHRYVLSMVSVADSAAYTGTVGNAVNLDFAGDASGADGDVESVGAGTTLTSWKSNVTAGQLWVIRLARDGNAAQDASTVNSYSGPLVIEYGITQ